MRGTVDLAVIGGGTAGIFAARTAALLGARVVLFEQSRLGGDCLWTGCVPSKTLLSAARAAHTMRTADRYGIAPSGPRVDFTAVRGLVLAAVDAVAPSDSAATLRDAGVEVVGTQAVFSGPREIVAGPHRTTFRRAVIASGSSPTVPPIPGLRECEPLTSDTVWDLKDLPASMAIIGGGPIGCELGQAFARFGVAVTIIEARPRLLPAAEPAASALLRRRLTAEGIDVVTAATVTEAAGGPGGATVMLEAQDGPRGVRAERVLVAAGRRPRTDALGLNAAGVQVDGRGAVVVDTRLRTSRRRIYAAGDVTGAPKFTHVAGLHGTVAASNAVLAPVRRVRHERIAAVTFTDPEVASVGLTEDQARAHCGRGVRVRAISHAGVDRAVTEGDTGGFTRIVLDRHGRVLGATVVAPRAGEMIVEIAALLARGAKLRDAAGVVHPYPTWSDGVGDAALAETVAALQGKWPRRATMAGLRLRRFL